jgi:hypothetical protein
METPALDVVDSSVTWESQELLLREAGSTSRDTPSGHSPRDLVRDHQGSYVRTPEIMLTI